MLVNGSAKDPDGNTIIVDEDEIIDLLRRILADHARKGERSDTIICWVLTALSKLSIRLSKNTQDSAKEMIQAFTDHMNVEIQQRACEYMQLFDKKWDTERHGIFEPIPIKSDLESKGRLYEAQADRPDEGEDDEEDSGIPRAGLNNTGSTAPIPTSSVTTAGTNMIDLDDLLGGLSVGS